MELKILGKIIMESKKAKKAIRKKKHEKLVKRKEQNSLHLRIMLNIKLKNLRKLKEKMQEGQLITRRNQEALIEQRNN